MDLKELAAEREARRKNRASSPAAPMPNPWAASDAAARSRAGTAQGSALEKTHRSVRMAHSLGLVICFIGILFLVLLANRWWGVCISFAGMVLARMGGPSVHGMIPALLQEGSTPTKSEVDAGALAGLFCLQGAMKPAASLATEWKVLLENLAFACTYGKRNCLTNDMYAGELTLGKICGLVAGKLRQGVVSCN